MTKKLICPNCGRELEFVLERINTDYIWRLTPTGNLDEPDYNLYKASEFYCPVCKNEECQIEEFVAEGD